MIFTSGASLAPLRAQQTTSTHVAPPSLLQAVNFTVEGKITQQSPGRLTLNTEGNIIFRVRYDDKTEIKRKDGSPGANSDLRVGAKVRVEGELTEAGEIIAVRIDLM